MDPWSVSLVRRPLDAVRLRGEHIPLHDIGKALRSACQLLGRSEKTAYLYVGWVRRYVMFHHNAHPAELQSQHVRAFLNDWSRSQTRPSASTQNQALHALAFLYQHVLHTPLPASSIKPLRAKRRAHLPEPVRSATLKQFLRQLTGTPRLVALLQLGCGLRLEEALTLRVSDLDLESKSKILVVRGLRERQRELPIPTSLAKLLRQHVETRLVTGTATADLPNQSRDPFVFTGNRIDTISGTPAPMQAQAVRRAYRAVRPYLSPHLLRQSYAIQQLDQGVPVALVHHRLGQRDFHATIRYASVSIRLDMVVRSPADDHEPGL